MVVRLSERYERLFKEAGLIVLDKRKYAPWVDGKNESEAFVCFTLKLN